MTLGQKQRLFSHLMAQLIVHAYGLGYAVTVGDFFRDHRVHGKPGVKKSYSHKNSVHKYRLAGDLNLFKPDSAGCMRYCTKTKDHRELGEFWESLHPLCRWGGRFSNPDGNHYSLEHNGVK